MKRSERDSSIALNAPVEEREIDYTNTKNLQIDFRSHTHNGQLCAKLLIVGTQTMAYMDTGGRERSDIDYMDCTNITIHQAT